MDTFHESVRIYRLIVQEFDLEFQLIFQYCFEIPDFSAIEKHPLLGMVGFWNSPMLGMIEMCTLLSGHGKLHKHLLKGAVEMLACT